MRVDYYCFETDWAAVQADARRAEACGFDGFAVPEITGDPFLCLGAAALATERIGLRTAIAVAFPRSPMMVANTAWALQQNSGGRFVLGLGTQVKGHNERRFSVPWRAPRARMREYVESLRAIWRCWEHGEPLDYRGEHYAFTLMTPEFCPEPTGLPPVPVYVAAVRPGMMKMVAGVADGIRLHGFCTRRYLEEVVRPLIAEGLAEAGRDPASFEVCGGGFIACGTTDEQLAKQLEWIRYRVAFYASTRTYQPVMSLHGWDDLAAKLHTMSKQGRWREMAAQVPDDVLHTFAAAAKLDALPQAIEDRFGGVSDTIELGLLDDAPDDQLRDVLSRIAAIGS